MNWLVWICIGIDIAIALFLCYFFFSPNQDAAGKGMLALPVCLLLICTASAWFLLTRNYKIPAIIISAVPAVIAAYILFLSIKKS